MSQTDSSASGEVRRTVQIPSLLTNSLRAVLDTFGGDIIRLQASGSIETTNGTLLDNLREYGVSWEQQDQQRVSIDYEQLPGADGPTNPLTAEAQTELLEEVFHVTDGWQRYQAATEPGWQQLPVTVYESTLGAPSATEAASIVRE